MASSPTRSSDRRVLPQARPNDARYEIVFPRRPSAVSAISGLFAALRDGFERGGHAVGDAYASAARVVLERKEALEDINAERNRPARDKASAITRS